MRVYQVNLKFWVWLIDTWADLQILSAMSDNQPYAFYHNTPQILNKLKWLKILFRGVVLF